MNVKDFKSTTIGEIVRDDYRAASVFKNHRIDFCCGGNKTLKEACEAKNIDYMAIISELNASTQKVSESINFDGWPLDLLVDYIEKKHHRYVESTIPVIKQYLKKLAAVHGTEAPELHEIKSIFEVSSGNLAQHMKKEELMLFPWIKRLVKAKMLGENLDANSFGKIKTIVANMEAEHELEGEHFRSLEQLSNNFTPPEWGCNTFHVGMKMLKEFQDDLHLHIHLENNILFPKAIELETEINQPAKGTLSI